MFSTSADLNAEGLEADPVDLLLMEGNKSSSPHPPSPHEPSSAVSPKVELEPQTSAGLSEKSHGRGKQGAKGQLLDDPAVMRTVEGPPSLKVWHGSVHLTAGGSACRRSKTK